VDHDKNGGNSGFDGDSADGVPPLLPGFIHPVFGNQAMLVLKNQRSQLE